MSNYDYDNYMSNSCPPNPNPNPTLSRVCCAVQTENRIDCNSLNVSHKHKYSECINPSDYHVQDEIPIFLDEITLQNEVNSNSQKEFRTIGDISPRYVHYTRQNFANTNSNQPIPSKNYNMDNTDYCCVNHKASVSTNVTRNLPSHKFYTTGKADVNADEVPGFPISSPVSTIRVVRNCKQNGKTHLHLLRKCQNLERRDDGNRHGYKLRESGEGGDCENSADTQNSNSWSYWLQGRFPLLILISLTLLGIFLALSGTLIYFNYRSSDTFRNLPSEDEPCESTMCAFGATCRVESGRATCHCPENCRSEYIPICGQDDVTYGNECLFRQYMCEHHKIVQIKHLGECHDPDPCEDKACLYGSICIPSANRLYASCECPTLCSNYKEDFQSVCGSDGKMYKNKCELDRLACRMGRNIDVRYKGKCDPCEGILCLPPQICHLSEERHPTCQCGEICSTEFNLVCGSDGKTYSNDCVLRLESCRSRRDLRIIYRGKCSSGVNPCESRTCRGYESCAINRFGIAQCTCAMVCNPVIVPVCGSDGKTYDNECQLTLSSCRESRLLTVAYRGVCDIESACTKHNCTLGATCVEKDGEPECECPICPSDYDPVCGSDGVSYQNKCHLQLEMCSGDSALTIRVLHSGLCNGCENLHCKFYSICELGKHKHKHKQGSQSGALCECPVICTLSLSSTGPVCGSDGLTYNSECELQKISCADQKLITVASRGHCDECTNVECKFGAKCESGICVCPKECPLAREPVCGSNLMTFMNECELRKAACRLGRTLNVHFYGDCLEGFGPFAIGGEDTKLLQIPEPFSGFSVLVTPRPKYTNANNPCEFVHCDFHAICELDEGFPRCTCKFDCNSSVGNPICGSDLKLYKNECEMQNEACRRQTELRPRPMELCEDIEVKPCYGSDPLRNPDTGKEINCRNGHSNCPAGSFCHRVLNFAKCCRKPQLIPTTTASAEPKSSFDSDTIISCGDSTLFGCCEDDKTPSSGPNYEGCPTICRCNILGSMTGECDPVTQECACRPGVGGKSCDRCLPGFWGLSRIPVLPSVSLKRRNGGCKPCGCSKFGSVRDDCEQMTGRCVCKPGVEGRKCDSCADGEFLGPLGCTIDSSRTFKTCEDLECLFGSVCNQDGKHAICACDILCDSRSDAQVHLQWNPGACRSCFNSRPLWAPRWWSGMQEVCANDGYTYKSDCHVQRQSCHDQIAIWIRHKGPCPEDKSGESESVGGSESTAPPVTTWKWALFGITEPGNGDIRWGDESIDVIPSSPMKSTRHLPQSQPPSQFERNIFHNLVPGFKFPTSASAKIPSYLGDGCLGNSECLSGSVQSICRNRCVCREGFYEDMDDKKNESAGSRSLTQCKPLRHIKTCSKYLCGETSLCYDHHNGSYACLCPIGSSNYGRITGCLENERSIPFFSGKSTILIGKLAGYHKLSIEVEITPYLDYAHGVIIFSSQHADATGDFVSLSLIDGYVEFRYDLGDGAVNLKSTGRLSSGKSYRIVFKRYNRDGLLRINGEEDVIGTSPGSMKSLNLENGAFIGYVPLNSTKVWELIGTSNGFVGCLHKLKIGRRQIEFSGRRDPLIRAVDEVYQCPTLTIKYSDHFTTSPYIVHSLKPDPNTENYQIIPFALPISTASPKRQTTSPQIPSHITPCSRMKCRNYGECWTNLDTSSGYRCVCSPEYSGKHCETLESKINETGDILDFWGFTYLELPKIENGARNFTIELWVMFRAENGLLVYNGQENGKGDCVALILDNGHIQFLFDLGNGIRNITWNEPLTLDKWHWITASQEGLEGKLQVDGKIPQRLKSPPGLLELNLEQLYVGGIRDTTILHRDLGIPSTFNGALQYLNINGETYHKEIGEALRRRLVYRNEGPPCGSSISIPCKNGGSCYPRLDSFACICTAKYTGETCEIRKSVPNGAVHFNGQNYLNFQRRISKRSGSHSRNHLKLEIVLRTVSSESGVILWTGRKYFENNDEVNRGYLGLFILEGFLELRVDFRVKTSKLPVILRSKVNVTDGRWHHVLIARRRFLIVFQVDGSSPKRGTVSAIGNNSNGNSRLWIGGVPPSILPNDLPPSYHGGFVGCIDSIRTENRRLPLLKVARYQGLSMCDEDD